MRLLAFVTAASLFTSSPIAVDSTRPTHLRAIGGDFAVVWSVRSKAIDVYSLTSGQYLRDLEIPGATVNTVLYDASRRMFWGTGSTNETKQRSLVWQWQRDDKDPAYRIVGDAARLWDVRQEGGRRYLTFESAANGKTRLAEVSPDLSLSTTTTLPDLVPREGDCVISGPSTPYDSSPYWIDFSSGKAIGCSNDSFEACTTLAWFQVPLAEGKSLLCCWSSADCFVQDSRGSLTRRSALPKQANVEHEITALFRDPWRDNGIYAWVGASAEAASLWKSSDDGVTWARVDVNGVYTNEMFFSEAAIILVVPSVHGEELDLVILRDNKSIPLHLRPL